MVLSDTFLSGDDDGKALADAAYALAVKSLASFIVRNDEAMHLLPHRLVDYLLAGHRFSHGSLRSPLSPRLALIFHRQRRTACGSAAKPTTTTMTRRMTRSG